MKASVSKFILIIVLCFSFLVSFAQNKNQYLKAFDYLRKKYPGKSFVICDTAINLGNEFTEDLSTLWGKSENATVLILDSLDHIPLKNSKLGFFKNFTKRRVKNWPAKMAYFSGVKQAMLTVEVFEIDSNIKDLSHRKLASYNRSDIYLFVFDVNGEIKNVFNSAINYD